MDPLVTEVAVVGVPPGVHVEVALQVVPDAERLAALGAGEGSLEWEDSRRLLGV